MNGFRNKKEQQNERAGQTEGITEKVFHQFSQLPACSLPPDFQSWPDFRPFISPEWVWKPARLARPTSASLRPGSFLAPDRITPRRFEIPVLADIDGFGGLGDTGGVREKLPGRKDADVGRANLAGFHTHSGWR